MASIINLNDFKTYKNISSTTYDSRIEQLIPYISSFIENYCGRKFSSTLYTEFRDANEASIILNNFPLISISSVNLSTDGGQTYTPLVENTDYYVDMENDSILAVNGVYIAYSAITFKSLKVLYTAGYSSMPHDLKLCAMDLLEYFKAAEYTAKEIGDAKEVYQLSGLPGHIKRTLDLYREI